jgi:hypothetical protein
MPIISFFYGIKIALFYFDHAPPHIHVYYAEHEAKVSIRERKILIGKLPERALRLVQEWLKIHEHEVLEDWGRAENNEKLFMIDPLS